LKRIIDSYQKITTPSIGEYKAKGSKFIAYAYFVETTEDIKAYLTTLKKEHFKARHHCYGWRLGLGKDNYRANDDGEPSGTAGRPILGQIDSFGLTNALVIVVRYFGGVKLGTSGLKNAYKGAAMDALSNVIIGTGILEDIYLITINYTQLSSVMQLLKNIGIRILDTEYTAETVLLKVLIRLSLVETVATELAETCESAAFDLIE